MNFSSFINRFFGRDDAETSKNMAKERLRLVLVHDRLDVSEQVMNALRVDLINVIGKYFGIDEKALEVSLSREADGMALVANIPIRRQKPTAIQEAQLKSATTESKTAAAANKAATPTKQGIAPPKQRINSPKQEAAPPKQEAAPPKQEAAPPKQEAAPPKQETAPPKQETAQLQKSENRQGKGKTPPKQPLPKKSHPEQAVEAYIK
jgi:cell division topological specificity factor